MSGIACNCRGNLYWLTTHHCLGDTSSFSSGILKYSLSSSTSWFVLHFSLYFQLLRMGLGVLRSHFFAFFAQTPIPLPRRWGESYLSRLQVGDRPTCPQTPRESSLEQKHDFPKPISPSTTRQTQNGNAVNGHTWASISNVRPQNPSQFFERCINKSFWIWIDTWQRDQSWGAVIFPWWWSDQTHPRSPVYRNQGKQEAAAFHVVGLVYWVAPRLFVCVGTESDQAANCSISSINTLALLCVLHRCESQEILCWKFYFLFLTSIQI